MLLDEIESKSMLYQAKINVNETYLAISREEALAIAERIGFPIVMKIVSGNIVHKTDAGGVMLNLRTVDEVISGYDRILTNVREKFPQAVIRGISVQKTAPPGIETIIGMTKDAQFGPVLMFGLGGIFVEILKDVSFRIVPITRKDAYDMIHDIKGNTLLMGYRGQSPVNISCLEEMIVNISRLVEENQHINEIDLNPVIAYSDGAVAVDARIIME